MEVLIVILVVVAIIGIFRALSPEKDSSDETYNADTSWYNASQNEFTITTAEQLAGLAELVNNGNDFKDKIVKLGQDIKLNNAKNWSDWVKNPPAYKWKSIGIEVEVEESREIPELEIKKGDKIEKIQHVIMVGKRRKKRCFNGIFDGNEFTVSGIYINNSENYQGLFGCVGSSGIIVKLKVAYSLIKGNSFIGGVAGDNLGIIRECYSMCNVVGKTSIGGLVGSNNGKVISSYFMGMVVGFDKGGSIGGIVGSCTGYNSLITESFSMGLVTGDTEVGGLVGSHTGTITDCHSEGIKVDGNIAVGGLVGYNNKKSTIENSYFKSAVTAKGRYTGGLVATNDGIINDCYSIGATKGKDVVGGLVGFSNGTISNSYSTSSVNGVMYVGGLVGINSVHSGNAKINSSYSANDVVGENNIGGLVGVNGSNILNSYSISKVKGVNSIGGLVGHNDSFINGSYSASTVIGISDVGKLVGKNRDESIVVHSYYENNNNLVEDESKGKGKTTKEMKDEYTYDGWDFDEIWAIDEEVNNGYPYLQENISNSFERNVKKYSKMLQQAGKNKKETVDDEDENPPEFWLSETQIEESLDPELSRSISEKLKNLHTILSTPPEEGKDLSMLLLSKDEIEKSLDPEFNRMFNKKIKILYEGLIDNKELDKSLFLFPDEKIDDSLDPDTNSLINEIIEGIYDNFPLFRWKGK